jgi:phospholipid-binding lipoprotein MlaA
VKSRPLKTLIALGWACALAGCATQGVDMRSLPAATPAADNAAAAENMAALSAAVANPASDTGDTGGEEPPPLFTPADAPSMHTYDPWERLNRFTYRFNARFDEFAFLPVANTYRRLPAPMRAGVHNFFANLQEVPTVVNDLLQWRLRKGVRSLARFIVNTTVGIGGLIDFAAKVDLPGAPTGFSATLATWGVHPGPYLVIPLLGPSTLRDGVGFAADFGIGYGINVANLYQGSDWETVPLDVLDAVDTRASIDFRYYATGSPFEYEDIRFLYVRKRLLEDAGLRRHEKPVKPVPGTPAGQ